MPLHLLSKKSWNVYNPAAIARVRADEAEAAAREEAHEQQLQEYEAAKRLALLRGEEPPAPPPLEVPSADYSSRRTTESAGEKRARDPSHDEHKKRRKLAGEDDTDRDIRVAREREEERKAKRDEPGATARTGASKDNVPLVDHAGHIQLFAAPSTRDIRREKEAQGREALEKKNKDADDDAGALRFADAAGFKKRPNAAPWYASRGVSIYSGTEEVEQEGERNETRGKDAFGNEDPGRMKRDAVRLSAADPMAAMAKAQSRLKQVERSRETSRQERERELAELKEMQRRDARRKHRHDNLRRHGDGLDSLDGFSLDNSSHGRGRDSPYGHGHRVHDTSSGKRSREHTASRDRHGEHRHRHHSHKHSHSHSHRHRQDRRQENE